MSLRPSDSIIGSKVVNPAGERVGTIEDLVLEVESGAVEYAVLSVGGMLGLGDKLFAVPLQAMRLDEQADQFVLQVDKDFLANAPGFNKAAWPDRPNPHFCRQVRDYYRNHANGGRSTG